MNTVDDIHAYANGFNDGRDQNSRNEQLLSKFATEIERLNEALIARENSWRDTLRIERGCRLNSERLKSAAQSEVDSLRKEAAALYLELNRLRDAKLARNNVPEKSSPRPTTV